MSKFTEMAKKAFEDYHNTPYESAEWTLSAALGHIMEFLEHHDSIDEMSGLAEALHNMTPDEWESWRTRYPEQRESLIEPLRRSLAQPTPGHST